MSYVERMQRISDYRQLRKNKPRRLGARIVSTPHIPRTREQQERVTHLTNELAVYKMKPEHTLCEHIRIVNQKIEELIHRGKSMNDTQKWIALYFTLPFEYGQHLIKMWYHSEESLPYDGYVYLFLEDNVWHNLNRTSKLAISPNIHFSKGPSINFS